MSLMPITLANNPMVTDTTAGGQAIPSGDGAQVSEFSKYLSESVGQDQAAAETGTESPPMHPGPAMQAAETVDGQNLPLSWQSLPPAMLPNTASTTMSSVSEAVASASAIQASITAGFISAGPAQSATAAVVQGSPVQSAADPHKLTAGLTAGFATQTAPGVVVTPANPLATVQQSMAAAGSATSLAGLVQAQEPQSLTNDLQSRTHISSQPHSQTALTMPFSQAALQQGHADHSAGGQGGPDMLAQIVEGKMATVDNGDFGRMIERGLAQLGREQPPVQALAVSEPAARTGLDGIRLVNSQLLLHQPMDKPEWNQEFGNRMVWMAREGLHNAQLRLTPAHLGTIEVKISIHNDQASISFMSQHGAVRDAIESSLPRLREMMHEAGVKLEQANVSSGHSHPNPQERQPGQNAARLAHHQFFNQSESDSLDTGMMIRQAEQGMLSAIDYYA